MFFRESSTHCLIFLRLHTPLHLLPLDALTLASLSATHAASAAYRCIRCLCLSLALRQMRPLSPSPSLPGLLLPLSQTAPVFRSPSLLSALVDVMYICFGSALPSPALYIVYRSDLRLHDSSLLLSLLLLSCSLRTASLSLASVGLRFCPASAALPLLLLYILLLLSEIVSFRITDSIISLHHYFVKI